MAHTSQGSWHKPTRRPVDPTAATSHCTWCFHSEAQHSPILHDHEHVCTHVRNSPCKSVTTRYADMCYDYPGCGSRWHSRLGTQQSTLICCTDWYGSRQASNTYEPRSPSSIIWHSWKGSDAPKWKGSDAPQFWRCSGHALQTLWRILAQEPNKRAKSTHTYSEHRLMSNTKKRLRIDSKVCREAAHPLYGDLSQQGFDPIKLAYNPCRPDSWRKQQPAPRTDLSSPRYKAHY